MKPRRRLPGSSYLVTRRCVRREFLLTPNDCTNSIVQYALAQAAKKSGVSIHTVCFMSNHWHAVVSDPRAELSTFLRETNRLIAVAQNFVLNRHESLWENEKPSAVELILEEDIFEKMVYVLVNPTAAGLVKSPAQWPGVITRHLGETRNVEMPKVFFDRNGKLEKALELTFSRPQIFTQLTDEQLNQKLFAAVEQRTAEARARRALKGAQFLGIAAVLQQSFFGHPESDAKRGGIKPQIACGDADRRAKEIQLLKKFQLDYRAALIFWRNGDRSQIFPAGTYALRVFHGANCEQFVRQ